MHPLRVLATAGELEIDPPKEEHRSSLDAVPRVLRLGGQPYVPVESQASIDHDLLSDHVLSRI